MTYELAEYFSIMLLCGYEEEYDAFLEAEIEQQEPLSDVILELALCGSDMKKALSVLNVYRRKIPAGEIDHAEVAGRVMSFLREKYEEQTMSVKELVELMHRLAQASGKYVEEEPWRTMYVMGDCYSEVEAGYLDREDYHNKLSAFLGEGMSFYIADVAPPRPVRSLLRQLIGGVKKK